MVGLFLLLLLVSGGDGDRGVSLLVHVVNGRSGLHLAKRLPKRVIDRINLHGRRRRMACGLLGLTKVSRLMTLKDGRLGGDHGHHHCIRLVLFFCFWKL